MGWIIAALTGLLVLIGMCMLASFPLVKPRRSQEPGTPSQCNLDFELIRFTTSDSILLKGWWIPADTSDRTIILLHGHAGSMVPDLKYAPRLHEAGFNVMMFDFRAHGYSGGAVSSLGPLEIRDVQSAIQFAIEKGSKKIGLLGFSMGGRAAILSATRIQGVNAILADGAPPRLLRAVQQVLLLRQVPACFAWVIARVILLGGSLLTGVNLFSHDPLTAARELRGIPVLIVQGGKDRFVDPKENRRMVASAGEGASLWVVPEATHRNIEETRPVEYLDRVITFFTDHMK